MNGPATCNPADATAVVTVHSSSRTRHASIACDGDGRRASGFWAADPATACDALRRRAARCSGPGGPRVGRRRVGSEHLFSEHRGLSMTTGIGCTNSNRMSNDHVPVTVVDRGAFPDDVVRSAHPLPAKSGNRRSGRPLLDRVIHDVRELPADPPCPLSADPPPVVCPHLAPIVDEPTWRTAARLYISVVLAAALDPPRGALPDRVGVQHSSPAHARPTPRVAPMDAYNGPRSNAPTASSTNHAMRHCRIPSTTPDRPGLCDSH